MIVARDKRKTPRILPNGPVFLHATSPAPTTPYTRHDMAFLPTSWGLCALVWKLVEGHPASFPSGFIEKPDNALLCRIFTPGLEPHVLRRQILARYPLCNEVLGDREGNFHPEVVPAWFSELTRYLRAFYTNAVRPGVSNDFTITWSTWRHRLDWTAFTPFQQAVLDHTAAIPRGQRLTYGQLARKIGKPRASRAVGAALGANAWPVLVPCHRVVGANGAMTGFSAPGGVDAKRRMLEMESPGNLF